MRFGYNDDSIESGIISMITALLDENGYKIEGSIAEKIYVFNNSAHSPIYEEQSTAADIFKMILY